MLTTPPLSTTLCLAGAAAIINLWLSVRIGQVRRTTGIWVGDGGHEALLKRMRAQANFVENVPFGLILFGLIEASGKGGGWLAIVGFLYMAGRVLHGLGMDGGKLGWGRSVGALTSWATQIGLGIYAVLVAVGFG